MHKLFTSLNVLLPGSNEPHPASIKVDGTTGKILQIHNEHRSPSLDETGVEWIDVGDLWILPGIVDAHVHLNEPGRTDWEGFWTGTQAAASGGVTTVVDMPLNSIPPTTTVKNLELKREAAQGKCFCDVAFWGGVIPGNQSHLKPLTEAGVKGFKCFLIDSAVEEFPCVSEQDLVIAMEELHNLPTVLLFHAELQDSEVTNDYSVLDQETKTHYSTFLDSRPQKLEIDAISLITRLQRKYPKLRCHIVHLSASSALPLIRAAKSSGLPLTVETCFHYLCLSSGQIPHGRPEFKCCPPIRDDDNRELLWAALQDGTIDCVVSDHSPCVAELKNLDTGDIMGAWGGISTLGLGLSLLWTEGSKRGISIGQIMGWISTSTAEHASLNDRKGRIAVGLDADLIIWDPNRKFTVTKEDFKFKNKLSLYEGWELRGRVHTTYLRGCKAFDRHTGGFQGLEPIGKLI